MEKSLRFGGRYGFLGALLGFFLLFCCTTAEEAKDPRANPNLSPFDQWLSAYKCMKNISSVCSEKYTLKESGWVNVTLNDTQDYCNGCANHTIVVLTCISEVKRDYWFADKSTVPILMQTIRNGCSSGFTGLATSNARKISESKTIHFVSALAAWFLITNIM